jgi:hypothetical protein
MFAFYCGRTVFGGVKKGTLIAAMMLIAIKICRPWP